MFDAVQDPADSRTSAVTVQDWAGYTPEQHAVWATLYRRRMETLATTGAPAVLAGLDRAGLHPDRIPDLADVNRRLRALTGWETVPVAGFVPADGFFRSLARRRFPTTITIRPADQLDYLPEPDIFHDVFGHVPLHSDPHFADLLARIGALGAGAQGPDDVTGLARLFWFTVEFGLVRDRGAVTIYGSGLVSSASDAANALSDRCDRRPFSLDAVLEQPFAIDRLQDVLFVAESLAEVGEAVREMGRRTRAAYRRSSPDLTIG